jgi:trimeric autotransporter adhesin
MAVTLNALTTGVGGLQTTGDTSGSISLQSNGSTVLAVTASGVTITGTLSSTSALPIASGGTGATTATAAFDALNPMTTTGDIIYESTPSVAARLPIGSTGQVLTVAGGLPSWAAAAGGQIQTQVFTAPGTWTKPSSTTQVRVTVFGGGGGGSGGATGSGGGFAVAMVPVSNPVAITVGAGGGASSPGGTSSFGPAVSCTGGTGGASTSPGAGTVAVGTALKTGGLTDLNVPYGSFGVISGVGRGVPGGATSYSTSSPIIAGAHGTSGSAGGNGGAIVVEFVG